MIARTKAGSLGSPLTPTGRPSRSRGRRIEGWAISAASGPLHERGDPDHVGPLLAGQAEVVDVEDADVDAPALQQLERVGLAARRPDGDAHAVPAIVALAHSGVDRRVDRVRGEVERHDDPVGMAGAAPAQQDERGEGCERTAARHDGAGD